MTIKTKPATDEYRDNWDRIFGAEAPAEESPMTVAEMIDFMRPRRRDSPLPPRRPFEVFAPILTELLHRIEKLEAR